MMRVVTVSVSMLEHVDNRICAVHFGKEALVKYACISYMLNRFQKASFNLQNFNVIYISNSMFGDLFTMYCSCQ